MTIRFCRYAGIARQLLSVFVNPSCLCVWAVERQPEARKEKILTKTPRPHKGTKNEGTLAGSPGSAKRSTLASPGSRRSQPNPRRLVSKTSAQEVPS